jgi:hypothetical protein
MATDEEDCVIGHTRDNPSTRGWAPMAHACLFCCARVDGPFTSLYVASSRQRHIVCRSCADAYERAQVDLLQAPETCPPLCTVCHTAPVVFQPGRCTNCLVAGLPGVITKHRDTSVRHLCDELLSTSA